MPDRGSLKEDRFTGGLMVSGRWVCGRRLPGFEPEVRQDLGAEGRGGRKERAGGSQGSERGPPGAPCSQTPLSQFPFSELIHQMD